MEIAVDNKIDIQPTTEIGLSVSNVTEAVVEIDSALDIAVTKKEYKIVGDEVYIAKLYKDAPQWMKDLVQLVVDNTVVANNAGLINDVVSRLNAFATSYVPLNTYTQSILDLSNSDASIHILIETLNSVFHDELNRANAQILELNLTKASKDEVVTAIVETIAAQILTPTSALGAMMGSIQQAIVVGDSANADSITTLMSTLEGEVDARATAVDALTTRVSNAENLVESQAEAITELATEVNNGTNSWATADSNVTNSLNTTINNGLTSAESKWAYNSNIHLGGTTYQSGFGLATHVQDMSIPLNSSEFWIKADKFRLVSNNGTTKSAYSPFSVDATTGQILMNGNVQFTNTTGGSSTLEDAVESYVAASVGSIPTTDAAWQVKVQQALNNNQTNIDGSRITTGTIYADRISANTITGSKLVVDTVDVGKIKANANTKTWVYKINSVPLLNGNKDTTVLHWQFTLPMAYSLYNLDGIMPNSVVVCNLQCHFLNYSTSSTYKVGTNVTMFKRNAGSSINVDMYGGTNQYGWSVTDANTFTFSGFSSTYYGERFFSATGSSTVSGGETIELTLIGSLSRGANPDTVVTADSVFATVTILNKTALG